jgi:hypothetical protein
MSRPLTAADVIYLHNAGVSTDVIQTMQTPPTPAAPGPVVVQRPPVIVEEHYYHDLWWGPHYGFHYHHHPRHCRPSSHVSWGVSVVK